MKNLTCRRSGFAGFLEPKGKLCYTSRLCFFIGEPLGLVEHACRGRGATSSIPGLEPPKSIVCPGLTGETKFNESHLKDKQIHLAVQTSNCMSQTLGKVDEVYKCDTCHFNARSLRLCRRLFAPTFPLHNDINAFPHLCFRRVLENDGSQNFYRRI